MDAPNTRPLDAFDPSNTFQDSTDPRSANYSRMLLRALRGVAPPAPAAGAPSGRPIPAIQRPIPITAEMLRNMT